jgi:hypothetical protein
LVFENGESVSKMKGISANFSEHLDFNTMRNLTLGKIEELEAFHDTFGPEQSKTLRVLARKRKAPCIVFPQFRLARSLTGRVWEQKNYTKAVTFRFVKRRLLIPTSEEKRETRRINPTLNWFMSNIIMRSERSTPWGFGESFLNDERMCGGKKPRLDTDY